jgi:hypothetical protein
MGGYHRVRYCGESASYNHHTMVMSKTTKNEKMSDVDAILGSGTNPENDPLRVGA